jgi:hypothetical protein
MKPIILAVLLLTLWILEVAMGWLNRRKWIGRGLLLLLALQILTILLGILAILVVCPPEPVEAPLPYIAVFASIELLLLALGMGLALWVLGKTVTHVWDRQGTVRQK